MSERSEHGDSTPEGQAPNIDVTPVNSGLRKAQVFENWPPADDPEHDRVESEPHRPAPIRPAPQASAGDGRMIRALQIALIVVIIVPILAKVHFDGQIPAPAPANVLAFEAALNLLNTDSNVLIVADWDGDVQGELNPIGSALIEDLFRRDAVLSVVALSPSGAPFMNRLLTRAADASDRTYGEDYVNYGYLPGEQAALVAFAGDFGGITRRDYHGSSVEDLPLAARFTRIDQAGLVIMMSGDAGRAIASLQQLSARYDVPVVIATSATSGLDLRPYVDPHAHQVAGLLAGLADLERWMAHKDGSDEYRPGGVSISAGLLVLLATLMMANLSVLTDLGRRAVRPRSDSQLD